MAALTGEPPLKRIDRLFNAAFPRRASGRGPVYPTTDDLMWLLAFAKSAFLAYQRKELPLREAIAERIGVRKDAVNELGTTAFAEIIEMRVHEAYNTGREHGFDDSSVLAAAENLLAFVRERYPEDFVQGGPGFKCELHLALAEACKTLRSARSAPTVVLSLDDNTNSSPRTEGVVDACVIDSES